MARTGRRLFPLALVAVVLLLAGCGTPGSGSRESGDGSGAAPSPPAGSQESPAPGEECGQEQSGGDPEDAVSHVPCPGGGGGGGPSGAERTEPQPGQADVHPVPWERVTRMGDVVRVFYWSGVEPCNVLDHVDVEETPRRVTITLFEGHTETEEDVVCIELALLKYTDVRLDAPVGDRAVKDGAAR